MDRYIDTSRGGGAAAHREAAAAESRAAAPRARAGGRGVEAVEAVEVVEGGSQGNQLAGYRGNQGYGRIPPKCTLTKFDMGNRESPHIPAPSVSPLVCLSNGGKRQQEATGTFTYDNCMIFV